jgi:hypothetical protein
MASIANTDGPRRQRGDLLMSAVVLLAIAVGGVVVLALADTTFALVLAVAVLAAATIGMALVARRMLATGDGPPAAAPARRTALALGAVATTTLLVVVGAGHEDASSGTTEAPDAAAANQTLRDFLATAVVDGSPYAACEYLTPPEQQRIARLAGSGQTCADALTATPPALPGVTTDAGVRRLHLRTTVHGARARTTVSGSGVPSLRFELRRATPAEMAAFDAPPAAWRIASGATALLVSPPSRGHP